MMRKRVSEEIVDMWQTFSFYGGLSIIGAGVLVFILYHLLLLSMGTPKKKYDFVCLNEIRFTQLSVLILSFGALVLLNNYVVAFLHIWLWLLADVAITLVLFGVISVFSSSYFRYYHPFRVEKKLKRLRYDEPRTSPNGRRMRLLGEDEEDEYLDKGMQAEEDTYAVDYDVWIDEVSGHTHIERYDGKMHAEQCPSCEYYTLKMVGEEVLKEPTTSEEGELLKRYTCSYCDAENEKVVSLRRKKEVQT